ncbi:MAG: NAD(P)H-binding protein [Gammaproteobacteria bacterium]|nr:NAD(P)H-binding protein [Gammaproteobacteria bacterium]
MNRQTPHGTTPSPTQPRNTNVGASGPASPRSRTILHTSENHEAPLPIAITGANGHIGRRLLRAQPDARAIVRSERAAATLAGHADVRVVDYADRAALASACAGCDAIVHLVGIIREGANASFNDAHERPAEALAHAARDAGASRIVYLSILGADPRSSNACLASRARTEAILADSGVPTVALRVPMVLGEDDYAAAALFRNARAAKRLAFTFRAGSMEQPIFAGDVVSAILAALSEGIAPGTLELAGPLALPRRDLIAAAAEALGTEPAHVLSLPLWLGQALAWTLERLAANPPLTRAMLGVLDHDDDIDPTPAAEALGIHLTPLAETLQLVLPTKGGSA